MTVEERKTMAEAWMKAGKGKLAGIVVHIGAGTLRDSQELARHAQKIGANAIACLCPTCNKPQTLEDHVEYMCQVAAEAPDTPFYLYDNIIVTGVKLNVDDFFTIGLTQIPTLCGVKHTSPCFVSMHTVQQNHGHRIQVLVGSEELFIEALTLGINVTVMNSVNAKILRRIKAAMDKGDRKTAFIEQGRVIAVDGMVAKHKLSIPGAPKSMLRALGLAVGSPRLPLSPVTESQVESVRRGLEELGYFDWGTN